MPLEWIHIIMASQCHGQQGLLSLSESKNDLLCRISAISYICTISAMVLVFCYALLYRYERLMMVLKGSRQYLLFNLKAYIPYRMAMVGYVYTHSPVFDVCNRINYMGSTNISLFQHISCGTTSYWDSLFHNYCIGSSLCCADRSLLHIFNVINTKS